MAAVFLVGTSVPFTKALGRSPAFAGPALDPVCRWPLTVTLNSLTRCTYRLSKVTSKVTTPSLT
jgi:hypothetical protein